MATREKKIFVVDDDEMLTTMLSDHLERKPYHQVSVFHTGEECLEKLYLEPDVIILDMNLNTVQQNAGDGLEILHRIRKKDEQAKVIILSGQKHYGKAAQTLAQGAMAYVMKDKQAFSKIDALLEELE